MARRYSDEDVVKTAAAVSTMGQLLIKLNLKPVGGNYANMRRKLQKLQVDCSHWGTLQERQASNKDRHFKDWSEYTRTTPLKRRLLKERGHRCEHCKNTDWFGGPIPLELDHVNGDRTNNDTSNLRLLCCNCHALTPTWRGRKVSLTYGHVVEQQTHRTQNAAPRA